jgi:hypothetical protein
VGVGFGDDLAAGAVVGGELNGPDAFEGAQGPSGGDGLLGQVGVGNAGGGELAADDRFDEGGEDAQGDVSGDAVFGPAGWPPSRTQCRPQADVGTKTTPRARPTSHFAPDPPKSGLRGRCARRGGS